MITGYLQQVQDSVTGIRCEYVTTTPLETPDPSQTSPNLSGPGTIVPGSYVVLRSYTDDDPPDPLLGWSWKQGYVALAQRLYSRVTGTYLTATDDGTNVTIDARVGTVAGTLADGGDARFTDDRFPTAHASTHATGGTDPVAPEDIGAATEAAVVAAQADATQALADASTAQGDIDAHVLDLANPHATTAAQVGADPAGTAAALVAAVTPASIGAVPTARTVSTTAPLQGGGALSGNLSLTIDASSTSQAGSMSPTQAAQLVALTGGVIPSVQAIAVAGPTQVLTATTWVDWQYTAADGTCILPSAATNPLNRVIFFTKSTLNPYGIYVDPGAGSIISGGSLGVPYLLPGSRDVTTLADTTPTWILWCSFVGAGAVWQIVGRELIDKAAAVPSMRTLGTGTPADVGNAGAAGSSVQAAAWDHVHRRRPDVVQSPAGNYTILVTDDVILADTSSARTIQLPDPLLAKWPVVVKDRTGLGGTNAITISRNGVGNTIDGTAADDVIETDYGATTYIPDGTNWKRIGSGKLVTKVYSVAGGYSWVCPPGRTRVTAILRPGAGGGGRGGGGGAGFQGATAGGGGGGAGGVGGGGAHSVYPPPFTVVPGTTYTLNVGAGGTAGTTGGTGGATAGANGVAGGAGGSGGVSEILNGGTPLVRAARVGIGGNGGTGGALGAGGTLSAGGSGGLGVAGVAGYPVPGISVVGTSSTGGGGGNGGAPNVAGGGAGNGGNGLSTAIQQYALIASVGTIVMIAGGSGTATSTATANAGGGGGGGGGSAAGPGDECLMLGTTPSGGTGGTSLAGSNGGATPAVPTQSGAGIAGVGGRGGGGGAGGAGSGGATTTFAAGGASGNGGAGSPGQIVLLYNE